MQEIRKELLDKVLAQDDGYWKNAISLYPLVSLEPFSVFIYMPLVIP